MNILANKEVVPEVIQNNANAEVLAQLVVELITNQEKQAQMQDEFMKIRTLLGSSGASARAAEAIIQTIGIVV